MSKALLVLFIACIFNESAHSQWTRTIPYVHLTTSTDRVGIGTSTPATKFHVLGTGTGTSMARLRVESSDNQAGISFLSTGSGEVLLYSPNNTNDFRINTNSSDRMIITEDGDFGFGTSPTSANFAVGFKRMAFGGAGLYGSYGTNDFVLEMRSAADSWVWLQGGLSGGQTFQSLKLGVSVSSGFTGIYSDRDASGNESYLPLAVFTGGSERMRILTDGNVGIGTTTASSRLSVNGNTRASDFILDSTGDSVSILSKLKVKSLTISNPGTDENLLCFKMERRTVLITRITAVLQGSSSPS